MENLLNSDRVDKYMPSAELRQFTQVLLSEDVKGNKSEAQRRTHVDRRKFIYAFAKNPEFRKWYSDQCDLVLGLNEGIPSYALMGAIVRGDVGAMRTFYELRGKIKGKNGNGNHNIITQISIKIEGTDGDKIQSSQTQSVASFQR